MVSHVDYMVSHVDYMVPHVDYLSSHINYVSSNVDYMFITCVFFENRVYIVLPCGNPNVRIIYYHILDYNSLTRSFFSSV